MAEQVVAGDGLDGRLGAAGRVGIATGRRVNQAGHQSLGDDVGLVLAAAQVGQVFAAHPVQFVLGEIGRQHNLAHHLQGAAPVLRERLRGEQTVLPAAVHRQTGPDELEVVGYLLAGLTRRTLRQHIAHHSGETGQVRRVRGRAGPQQHAEGHDGHSPLLYNGDAHTVGQAVADGQRRGEHRLIGRRRHDVAVNDGCGGGQRRFRQHPQPHLVVPHVGFGHTQDVLTLDGKAAVEAGVDQSRIGLHYVEVVELVRAPAETADAGELAEVSGLDAVLGAGDFLVGGRVAVDVLQLGLHCGLHLVQAVALGGGNLHQ